MTSRDSSEAIRRLEENYRRLRGAIAFAGLLTEVDRRDEEARGLLEEAREWAERLARGPSFGLEITKKMVLREAAMDLESALAAETEIQAACMEDPNFREAYDAFVEKRKPEFG